MAMDADVRLLIGVARGGADGDSEALIRKELNEIMGKIKLEAKLDSKSFGEQIRKQLDAISKNGICRRLKSVPVPLLISGNS